MEEPKELIRGEADSIFKYKDVAHTPVKTIISICRFSMHDNGVKRMKSTIHATNLRAQIYLKTLYGGCCKPEVSVHLLNGISSHADFSTLMFPDLIEFKKKLESIKEKMATTLVLNGIDGFTTNLESWYRVFKNYKELQLVVFPTADDFEVHAMRDVIRILLEMSCGIHHKSCTHEFIVRLVQCSLNKLMYINNLVYIYIYIDY